MTSVLTSSPYFQTRPERFIKVLSAGDKHSYGFGYMECAVCVNFVLDACTKRLEMRRVLRDRAKEHARFDIGDKRLDGGDAQIVFLNVARHLLEMFRENCCSVLQTKIVLGCL